MESLLIGLLVMVTSFVSVSWGFVGYSATITAPSMVLEDVGTVDITVGVVRGDPTATVTVMVATGDSQGSATSGEDFFPLDATIQFPPGTNEQFLTLIIINDGAVEPAETLSVQATIINPAGGTSMPSVITIINDDFIGVGFENPQYTYSESDGFADVCVAILYGTTETDVTFSLTTSQGTASNISDYAPITINSLFSPMLSTLFCVQITIVADNATENTEFFFVNLSSENGAVDTRVGNTTTVFISDINGAVMNVVSSEGAATSLFSVLERDNDTTVSVCVQLLSGGGDSGRLERNVSLMLTTVPHTAGKYDFMSVESELLVLPTGLSNGDIVCTTITILGDTLSEPTELFNFTLVPTNIQDTINNSATVIVEILNDDFINCGVLPAPENGLISVNTTTFNSIVSYDCDYGYQLTGGNLTRTCLATGNWSNIEPTCSAVNCGVLPAPENGLISVNTTTFNSTVSYDCNYGYQLTNGSVIRACLATGNWSGSEPTCLIINCGVLPAPENGLISVNTTTFNSTVSYECNYGYQMTGGNLTRTCLATGNWSNIEPTCTVVNCGILLAPKNGLISVNTTTFNSIVSYDCNYGYQLANENATRTCLATGNWSYIEPTCLIINCGVLPAPENGLISVNTTTFNSTVSYECDYGYQLTGGNLTRTCLATGNWSNIEPTCTVIDCGRLPVPENGLISVNTTTFNSIVSYDCNYGYQMTGGNLTRTCLATGNWSNIEPTCSIIDCGPLLSPTNGTVFAANTTFLSVALYSCDNEFVLIGVSQRVCEVSGRWSDQEPVCIIREVTNAPPITQLSVSLVDHPTFRLALTIVVPLFVLLLMILLLVLILCCGYCGKVYQRKKHSHAMTKYVYTDLLCLDCRMKKSKKVRFIEMDMKTGNSVGTESLISEEPTSNVLNVGFVEANIGYRETDIHTQSNVVITETVLTENSIPVSSVHFIEQTVPSIITEMVLAEETVQDVPNISFVKKEKPSQATNVFTETVVADIHDSSVGFIEHDLSPNNMIAVETVSAKETLPDVSNIVVTKQADSTKSNVVITEMVVADVQESVISFTEQDSPTHNDVIVETVLAEEDIALRNIGFIEQDDPPQTNAVITETVLAEEIQPDVSNIVVTEKDDPTQNDVIVETALAEDIALRNIEQDGPPQNDVVITEMVLAQETLADIQNVSFTEENDSQQNDVIVETVLAEETIALRNIGFIERDDPPQTNVVITETVLAEEMQPDVSNVVVIEQDDLIHNDGVITEMVLAEETPNDSNFGFTVKDVPMENNVAITEMILTEETVPDVSNFSFIEQDDPTHNDGGITEMVLAEETPNDSNIGFTKQDDPTHFDVVVTETVLADEATSDIPSASFIEQDYPPQNSMITEMVLSEETLPDFPNISFTEQDESTKNNLPITKMVLDDQTPDDLNKEDDSTQKDVAITEMVLTEETLPGVPNVSFIEQDESTQNDVTISEITMTEEAFFETNIVFEQDNPSQNDMVVTEMVADIEMTSTPNYQNISFIEDVAQQNIAVTEAFVDEEITKVTIPGVQVSVATENMEFANYKDDNVAEGSALDVEISIDD